MIELVKSFAKKNGVIAGVCDATPTALREGFVPFVSADAAKRTNPAALLDGAASVIVLGVPQKISIQEDRLPVGNLSFLAVAEDYHGLVKGHLRQLAGELAREYRFRRKILVDSPFLDEREFARRAGLGFMGRNGLLISPQFGSRFNIGLLLTDIPAVAVDTPVEIGCPDSCQACRDACPTGALREGYNVACCMSYLTQKDELTPAEEELLNGQLYGCDICQNCCPFNHSMPPYGVNPEDWLRMSDAQLKEKYAHTAMSWKSPAVLKRNARIALAHSLGENG
ncbi:MAG: DUF1730 domain-containing protein [Defluviitaleaceae bacterium]|nr:DUF1730 domain-containing protein [Defluviitaleaceae bacterium]